jgi:saccharopine dehydrogenase (NAD+, L-lysine-forming)
VAVRTLTLTDHFDEVVIGELRTEQALALAESLSSGKVSVAEVDAEDPAGLARALKGSDVVLNCIGPFYRFGPPVLRAVIEAGIDYVDVCDDLDATQAMLELDGAARAAGVTALIGMGNSPGLANVLARFCAEEMLDHADAVDIHHAHGGEPEEGAGVIKHRIHAMTNPVPLFLDGRFIEVMMLDEDGLEHAEESEFREIGAFTVYPYPHPETVTVPKYLQGVKRVTNKGCVLPTSYFQLTMDAVRLGLASQRAVQVGGSEVIPLEFAVAWIREQRPRLLAEAGLDGPMGCLKVVVTGRKAGDPHAYVFSMSSRRGGAGEGTGIPAALGAMMMRQGAFREKGVLPPEALVKPLEMLQLASEVVKGYGMALGEGGGLPIHIEHVGPAGTSEELKLEL